MSNLTFQLSSCPINVDRNEGTKLIFNPYFFVPVNFILSVSELFGNVLILVALQDVLTIHPPSKLLFRCLSSTDLCVGLISQPVFIVYLFTIANKKWNWFCGLSETLAYISSSLLCGESITTLTAMSVDRLLALRYRTVVSFKRFLTFVITSWISNFALAMTYFFNKRFFFSLCCICIASCLCTSTCCYAKIYTILHHKQAHIHENTQNTNRGGVSFMNMERYKRTVSGALYVNLTLVVCYVPYTVTVAVSTVYGKTSENVIAWNIAAIVVYINSLLNPFLYCWKLREVRQVVKGKLRKWLCFQWKKAFICNSGICFVSFIGKCMCSSFRFIFCTRKD